MKKMNLKNSIQRNRESKDSETRKPKIPLPPAPPKRRGKASSNKTENKIESVPDISRNYLKSIPKVKASITNEEAAPQ